MKILSASSLVCISLLFSCSQTPAPSNFITDNIKSNELQQTNQIKNIERSGLLLHPRSLDENGAIRYAKKDEWTSGFYSGILWYTYDLSKKDKWKKIAEKHTVDLDSIKHLTWHHDVGFIIGSSFLNGYRIAKIPSYKDVVIEAARSLSTRFRPAAGVIQSWDADKGWQAKRHWKCPVIIDTMMNLELLFEATTLSGDSTFYNIAKSHAEKTLQNHYRTDNSSYHVVDYNPQTGDIRSRVNAQGYSDESAWARGQAWGIYGYTVCYRYTHDKRFLEQAMKIQQYIFNNPQLPEDLVPYWDYNAPNIPNAPRDASAASCAASALYELSTYQPNKGYKKLADKIMTNLASPAYRTELDTNGNFLLKHSVGSIPHHAEIDVPIVYADYFFLEGLIRKRNLENNKPVLSY